jgi:hypothetical protein
MRKISPPSDVSNQVAVFRFLASVFSGRLHDEEGLMDDDSTLVSSKTTDLLGVSLKELHNTLSAKQRLN